jgi:hypothetical protein
MSIHVQPTPEHQALAAAVEARMAADRRIVNARAAMFRLLGVGAALALAGLGVALALFGWSFVKDERPSADRIADALVRALDRTTLKTAGEVRLAPDSTVRLEAGPPQPVRPLAPAAAETPAAASPASRAVTNYTVFKNVRFGKGLVVTGWTFDSSDQPAPSSQYCYYSESMGGSGAQLRIDIAAEGVLLPDSRPKGVDAPAAAASCVWFDGAATRRP